MKSSIDRRGFLAALAAAFTALVASWVTGLRRQSANQAICELQTGESPYYRWFTFDENREGHWGAPQRLETYEASFVLAPAIRSSG